MTNFFNVDAPGRYRPTGVMGEGQGLHTVSLAGRVGAAAQGGGTNDMQGEAVC